MAEGLALLLSSQPDIEVIAHASTVEEALRLYCRHTPDVTVMDLRLGSGNGAEAIRAIRSACGDARIIVLSMYQGDEDVRGALEAGATVYLLKDTVSDELIRVVRDVHAGRRPSSGVLLSGLSSPRSRLTPRERQVIEYVAGGLRNKDVAQVLGISEETVEVHLRHIFEKLDVEDRTAAVNVALRRGIIHVQ